MSFDLDSYILKNFSYNPVSGQIERSDRLRSNGSLDHYGYRVVKIKGRQVKAHRLAWFLYHKKWPVNVIDHINGDKTDNRIGNLRDVHQSVNVKNTKRPPNKDTGHEGIYLDKCTKGLVAVYTLRSGNKTKRFRSLIEAVNFKKEYLI